MPNQRVRRLLSYSLLAILGGLVACTIILGPHFHRMGTLLHGAESDNLALVWELRAIAHGEMDGSLSRLANFPFGRRILFATYSDPFVVGLASWLARATNEVFTLNLLFAIGYLFSGASVFALVLKLTSEVAPSVVSGLAYMLLPYHQAMSQYHFSLSRLLILPLFLSLIHI